VFRFVSVVVADFSPSCIAKYFFDLSKGETPVPLDKPILIWIKFSLLNYLWPQGRLPPPNDSRPGSMTAPSVTNGS
jgi:hypothetical protein